MARLSAIGGGAIAALIVACSAAAGPAAVEGPPAQAALREGFGVEDYFQLHRITDLALSSDGNWLAYSVAATSLADDRVIRRTYLQPLSTAAPATGPDALEGAWSLAWIPGAERLAFLSDRSGSAQVHSLNVGTGEVLQLTRSDEPVISFRFAPDGRNFAFATRAPPQPGVSLYEQFRTAESGILINTGSISSHDFVNPEWNAMAAPQPPKLWIADSPGRAKRVPVPGEPLGREDHYFWSPGGDALSLAYVADGSPSDRLGSDRSSIGIFDIRKGRFRPVASAAAASEDRPGISYSGGEWLAGGRLLVRRVIEKDPWVSGSFPDWTVLTPSGKLPGGEGWRNVELYPGRLRIFPMAGSILVETTLEGEHSLFTLAPEGLRTSALVAGLDGSSSAFSFSRDGKVAAFVNESLARPPEIFVKRGPGPARRLTRINEALARKVGFTSREFAWKSSDGVTVKGWLLEPKAGAGGPLPLITHVHGGPAFPFPNAFAAYFSYWPYPLEAYPSRGIAVFLPNYRGTHSYGREIATATGEEQAIADIVSGVKALIDAGVADPARLGISGHSHGALVGPLAMARSKMFQASSFAEGVSNQVVMYELMSGDANRYIHDPTIGVSLYQSPETYIRGSADLQLEGVKTASLFEAGAKTSAIFMLGLAKASERFGMPSEFIIYPKTAHNLAIPALQRESADRNLDWFDFWLNGRASPQAATAERYSRWRALARPGH